MGENIFFSSNNFEHTDIKSFLTKITDFNIRNIELGSNLEFSDKDLGILFKYTNRKMKFLVHNYFPRQKTEFVLNLASNNNDILKKSIKLCKKAIDLSKILNAPFYSVHAGFAFHASPRDLSKKQTHLPRFSKKIAYKIFLESIKELANYSRRNGVMLAIENNVVASFNVCNGKNPLFLLAGPGEFSRFYSDVGSSNLFYLIDTGHLKVSSNCLGFSVADFLEEVIPLTIAFHLNDNDSKSDQHLSFDDKVWFRDLIREFSDRFLIIETKNINAFTIKNMHKIIKMLRS